MPTFIHKKEQIFHCSSTESLNIDNQYISDSYMRNSNNHLHENIGLRQWNDKNQNSSVDDDKKWPITIIRLGAIIPVEIILKIFFSISINNLINPKISHNEINDSKGSSLTNDNSLISINSSESSSFPDDCYHYSNIYIRQKRMITNSQSFELLLPINVWEMCSSLCCKIEDCLLATIQCTFKKIKNYLVEKEADIRADKCVHKPVQTQCKATSRPNINDTKKTEIIQCKMHLDSCSISCKSLISQEKCIMNSTSSIYERIYEVDSDILAIQNKIKESQERERKIIQATETYLKNKFKTNRKRYKHDTNTIKHSSLDLNSDYATYKGKSAFPSENLHRHQRHCRKDPLNRLNICSNDSCSYRYNVQPKEIESKCIIPTTSISSTIHKINYSANINNLSQLNSNYSNSNASNVETCQCSSQIKSLSSLDQTNILLDTYPLKRPCTPVCPNSLKTSHAYYHHTKNTEPPESFKVPTDAISTSYINRRSPNKNKESNIKTLKIIRTTNNEKHCNKNRKLQNLKINLSIGDAARKSRQMPKTSINLRPLLMNNSKTFTICRKANNRRRKYRSNERIDKGTNYTLMEQNSSICSNYSFKNKKFKGNCGNRSICNCLGRQSAGSDYFSMKLPFQTQTVKLRQQLKDFAERQRKLSCVEKDTIAETINNRKNFIINTSLVNESKRLGSERFKESIVAELKNSTILTEAQRFDNKQLNEIQQMSDDKETFNYNTSVKCFSSRCPICNIDDTVKEEYSENKSEKGTITTCNVSTSTNFEQKNFIGNKNIFSLSLPNKIQNNSPFSPPSNMKLLCKIHKSTNNDKLQNKKTSTYSLPMIVHKNNATSKSRFLYTKPVEITTERSSPSRKTDRQKVKSRNNTWLKWSTLSFSTTSTESFTKYSRTHFFTTAPNKQQLITDGKSCSFLENIFKPMFS